MLVFISRPSALPFGSHARRDKEKTMRILLYNPDNGVTRNFMPHLWMFLLQALTPAGHEVVLIDGNAQPMDEEAIARFVIAEKIGLVGIGAMTRMIAKAYRMADAIRAVGVPVVMGGPHVTEMADEAKTVSTKGIVDGKTRDNVLSFYTKGETWDSGNTIPYKETYTGVLRKAGREIAFQRFNDVPSGGEVERFIATPK